jgi:murein L,D-transpeptidase YafK
MRLCELKRPTRIVLPVLCLMILAGILVVVPSAQATKSTKDAVTEKVPNALIDPGEEGSPHILVVEKSSQTIHLYQYEDGKYRLAKSMACSTGENVGDKAIEGDKKTPEGFYIFNKKSLEHELAPIYGILAYPMDYPNFWDRKLGKKGGGIWMHGTNKDLVPLDSNGCVELQNIDIMNLEGLLRLYDTPIVVYHDIEYARPDQLKAEAAKIKAFIESWRKAWVNKDFQAYKSKYSKNFVNSDNRSYQAWMDHKHRLNEVYKEIHVDIKNLRIFRHQGLIVALFDQYYRGDGHFKSDGQKRLYLREKGGDYRIVAEVWQSFPAQPPEKVLSAEVKERVKAEVRQTQARLARMEKIRQAKLKEAAEEPVGIKAAKAESTTPPPPKVTASITPAAKPKETPPQKPQPVVASADAAKSVAVPSKPEVDDVRLVVEQWLNAWRKMDVDQYMAHYHPEFRYKGMDLDGYRAYKIGLAEKYNKISIKVEQLNIEVNGGKAKVTFVQDYRSDKYRDYGLKTLVLKKHADDWRIREESWQDMSAGAKP